MKGEIEIGTVLHPQCKILAESGPIVIGSNNIIEENVTIINKQPTSLIIGDENVFEVGCYVEGSKIGSKNIIEAKGKYIIYNISFSIEYSQYLHMINFTYILHSKARILGTTSLGDNCVIGAVCSTRQDEVIPNDTVIYGDHHNRRTQTACASQQSSLHTRHLDYLREVLPKFNHVRIGGASTATESLASKSKLKSSQSFIISFDLDKISTPKNNLALINANLVARNSVK
ncbi:11365_t:CDS:2, partial [Scutellospora calospora]